MGLGSRRERTLYGILAKARVVHRYTVVRWVVGVVFTIAVALLPWTDTMRFDFWGGRHMVLGREVGIVEASRAFAWSPRVALRRRPTRTAVTTSPARPCRTRAAVRTSS